MNKGAVNITALYTFVYDEVKNLSNDVQIPAFHGDFSENFVLAKP